MEGFQVDCAFDGESGLARALSRCHDVILLDRMLPDLSGDVVLERLRTNGKSTPVLILTGFPDYQSALHAGRFNVSDYLVKSAITGADLAASIRNATAQAAVPGGMIIETKSRLFSAYGGTTSRSFSDLVLHIRSDEVKSSKLSHRLSLTISARDLTFAEFLATSKSLNLLNRKADLPFHVALSTLHDWLDPASTARSLSPRLKELLAHLEAAGRDWPRICASDCEAVHKKNHAPSDQGTDPATPTFHQCKKAVVMRRAVLELFSPNEQIRQIAYRLGYSDHGNFDHEFRAFFAVSPTAFRRLQIS